MPPKPGLAPSVRLPLKKLSESAFYFCPSCFRHLGHNPRLRPQTRLLSTTPRRRFSSQRSPPPRNFASSSAINATENVPERFAELYQALTEVRNTAANHVNLSRLHLALRGLETERPVIRVAVLSLGETATTARLVRLLLADPLSPRAEWEDYLAKHAAKGGLLIKYGEQTEVKVADSLVPTISIPSTILKKANVQIYLSSLGAGAGSTDNAGVLTPSTLYVPTIAIPSTSTGSHSVVRFPVHRTIICGKGIDDLLIYNRLVANEDVAESESCRAVFELNLPQRPQPPRIGRGAITFVDMERAEAALEKFRQSVQNASEYEQGWLGSGAQPLIDWLSQDYQNQSIHPDIKRLADSLLRVAEKNMLKEEKVRTLEHNSQAVSDDVRNSLDEIVSKWSEQAHTELRDALDEGFMGQGWRDLAWWKLFWRADDVGMLMSGILEKKWLPKAEKEAIWLSGRIQQAGLLSGDCADGFNQIHPSPNESAVAHDAWAAQIGRQRDSLMNTRVPSLHALAQRLVAFSMSTSTLTSALAILTYVSTSSTSIYEAGTVAAVGLVYSFRRQQKRWDAARGDWESEVREEGRKALKETEDALRVVIKDGGPRPRSVTDTEARDGIEKAKKALSDVK